MSDFIRIKGASQHNLKNITLDIPRNQLVVITGVSGSGKSSLAFDTIYAEGQRRYVESLSTYARQFIGQMDKPDVESIEGLSPAIAIEQRSASHNPRSTVGTVTEIYDYLRLLFARIGIPHCTVCGREIRSQKIDTMVETVLNLPEKTRLIVLAPIVRGKKGEFQKEFKKLQREGYVRVRIDGEIRELEEEIRLDKKRRHDIDVVVDRLVLREGIRQRLRDSLETASALTDGLVRIDLTDGKEILFSEKYSCPICGVSLPELAPRLFSFNSPYGACPDCSGLGTRMYFDEDLVVPDPALSIREGAIAPWAGRSSMQYFSMMDALAQHYGFDLNSPFRDLPENIQNVLLYGSGEEEIQFFADRGGRRFFYNRPFEGVLTQLDRRYHESPYSNVRMDLSRYISLRECPTCLGTRLKKESLAVTVNGKNIQEVCLLSIRECMEFFSSLSLSPQEILISERILKEIKDRLTFLLDVGMDYLDLARSAGTLSGGEGQRIRLATQIGSGLVGVLYVLDEPTVGLHQRDNERLISTLKRLRDMGNTVLVVEHDQDMMLASDSIIDMGPGAGVHGGEVTFQGTPGEIMESEASLTGQYLSGRLSIPLPPSRRPLPSRFIHLEGAHEHNLKDLAIRIPVGVFTAVTGVSGSGKSTMIIETLHRVMSRQLNNRRGGMGKIRRVVDLGGIERVILINQQPIGRTPRSNPVTYTGGFSFIRDLFTGLPEARMRGYKPGRFSFNVKGGRCEACEGNGMIKIEMHFLPDVYVTCDACGGKRFNPDTLDIRYKDKNIADVLDMTVNQGLVFFENIPAIRGRLQSLFDVGLGYIRLGQSATTLSGGEAQRIKLSRELGKRANSNTLYILDEPTIGLHFADIQKLLNVLMRLVDMGNSVVVIEHNLDVIKSADYIIDLGPEGGPGGGRIMASGTPEEVAAIESCPTGRFLRAVLEAGSKESPEKKEHRR
ncbi:Excinuclease ABC subunit A [Syntrophus gentianae]|uniref:UvrABC system protein A n=1 Tax=Syntrophus gentianae TaxID=43775 RepID=A0A1H7YM43_9BACT|nr:excinuclease ABC subunit UvrA [Syntrophus gentianae]SEM47302.1 Excinuclease ABC subunit A [Syntrophus gentianae]